MTTPMVYESLPIDQYYAHDRMLTLSHFWSVFDDVHGNILVAGCGRGDSLKAFRDRGEVPIGYDFNTKLLPLWRSIGVMDMAVASSIVGITVTLRDRPEKISCFDWCVSSDYIEHLTLEALDYEIRIMQELAAKGRHIVDLNMATVFVGPDGESLHHISEADLGFLVSSTGGLKYPLSCEFDAPDRNHAILSWGD